jgi:hypothetical protein
MRKSSLERVLGGEKVSKEKRYTRYYTAITGTFAAGNAMAYLAYGMHGLFDAMGIDFITLGFTLYEQLKMKQENDKIDNYVKEVKGLEKEEKIGLISMGEGNNTESKAKKVGYIVYQLFKGELGESKEIERQYLLSSNIIETLEKKGYIKSGIMGKKLTKKGKLAYYSIFNDIKDENKNLFYMLKKLYNISENELLPVYQLYVDTAKNEKREN